MKLEKGAAEIAATAPVARPARERSTGRCNVPWKSQAVALSSGPAATYFRPPPAPASGQGVHRWQRRRAVRRKPRTPSFQWWPDGPKTTGPPASRHHLDYQRTDGDDRNAL